MLCTEEMGTLLSRYVDGELAEKERKSIEAHLETCASCRDVLNLFQRNDNVLNNALVGEAFGAQTVDAVMTEIRRLEEPVVVAPAVDDDPAPPPVAMRQVIQVTRMWPFAAAAALMIACVGGFLAVAKYGGFGGSERAELEKKFAAANLALSEIKESQRADVVALDRVRELSQELRDFDVRAKLNSTKESTPIAYVNGRSIVVQANYSTDKFFPFEVHRAKEQTPGNYTTWERMKTDLPTPHFRDNDVEPGVNYMYSIRAIYRDSDFKRFENSAAVIQMLPLAGGLDPRRSLRIRFIGAMPDLTQATFEVSRYENEKLLRAYFTVKTGEKIGGVQSIDGKDVDLSTRHTLVSIAPSEERISFGTDHLVRPSRQATLKADPKAKELLVPSFTLALENEQYIPLPK